MRDEMMAAVIDEFGPPSVLCYRSVPIVRPGPDDVVVQVHAVSINRTLDLAVRQNGDGRNVTLPLVLGVDPSGIVRDVGTNVTGVNLGDRVAVVANRCGTCTGCTAGGSCIRQFHPGVDCWGGYAEFITVPAWTLVPVPDTLDFSAATLIFRHYPTAHRLLRTIARIQPGEVALVLGSAGGLGSACVEVAHMLGATVIAGAGSDERAAAGLSLGADESVNYRANDLEEMIGRFTGDKGVDVVVDNIGDPTLWPAAFGSLAQGGRLVTAGAHGGGRVQLDLRRLYQRHLAVLGSSGRAPEDLDWVLEHAAKGAFHPLIGELLSLSQASRAHELVAANAVVGKVLLNPRIG